MSGNHISANSANLSPELESDFEAFVRRSTLAANRELGDAVKKQEQRIQLLQRKQAKANIRDTVGIGNLATQVGLTGLTGVQLRGALLSIVAGAKDPQQLAHWAAAGQAWLDERSRALKPGQVEAFVTAAQFSSEMVEACSILGLRRVKLPRGYAGRLTLADAIELGEQFGATVQITRGDSQPLLVDRGRVETALVAEIRGGLDASAIGAALDSAEPTDRRAEPTRSEPEESEDARSSSDTELLESQERPTASWAPGGGPGAKRQVLRYAPAKASGGHR